VRWRLAVLVPAGGVIAFALGIACGDPSHVFEGRFYLPARDCLGTPSSIDVVEGDRPADNCPAVCLAQPQGDGGRFFYVSTMCPPFPFAFDASGSDPTCPAVLAAFGRNATCLLDGGSSAPLPPPVDAAATD
jgi:hypothetical protein